MKYWKRSAEDICGTMNDDGFVPNSILATKEEYKEWVEKQKEKIEPKIIKLKNLNTNEIVAYQIV